MKVKTENGRRDMRALWFEAGKLTMIDQRSLPHQLRTVDYETCDEVAAAIKDMVTRGAPSIGAAAAYGICLAALKGEDLEDAAARMKAARPTANDLFYAVDHMMDRLAAGDDPVQAAEGYTDSIIEKCRMIGEHGGRIIQDGFRIMTHCNAGALATVDHGTALAPIRQAFQDGKSIFVYASETRPRLQGAQLTAWELNQEDIPHSIIVDGASGHFLRQGVDMVIVGADRIVANGDFANKIGTYEKAVLAKELGIPFYVAAPVSTFDFEMARGEDIPIEERSEEEVTVVAGNLITPSGSKALNPAFDYTPARYVTAFITELGLLKPEDISRLRRD
ncbi:MAG: S-methyl-5-thioribose-1-phosphate isomerase [Candidatus Methanomethylophilaceae archaeon]|nr:S-methyl-5-thioribose-1-phosphate isomerase [Candidatus Methanomethylophilaceae archaeon]